MGDTDYDFGWNAGYEGLGNEPPSTILDKEAWRNGYSDGVAQFNADTEDYYCYEDDDIW